MTFILDVFASTPAGESESTPLNFTSNMDRGGFCLSSNIYMDCGGFSCICLSSNIYTYMTDNI
jgi:hypothetical protein